MTPSNVTLISSSKSWIEGKALEQLKHVAGKPGIRHAVGMPDLHPGRGIPVGAAVISDGLIYPFLIGNDIGCGIGLWQTQLKVRKMKLDRWVKRLNTLPEPEQSTIDRAVEEHALSEVGWISALGTVGGGNHFAELTRIDEVLDHEQFAESGLNKDRLLLMVHSGSRGLGESILRRHVDRFRDGPLECGSQDAERYLERHDSAVRWATLNRFLVMQRFLSALSAQGELVSDTTHNSLCPLGDNQWLHRKGAAPADGGPVVVAGSRGTLSYLVQPTNTGFTTGFSIAHGAGRKWNRSQVKPRLSGRFSAHQLRQTPCGNRVICDDKAMLYEEAPQAYKDIEQVIADLKSAGLIKVIATLQPVITYKNG